MNLDAFALPPSSDSQQPSVNSSSQMRAEGDAMENDTKFVQGDNNRVIQGNDNWAVVGDSNTIINTDQSLIVIINQDEAGWQRIEALLSTKATIAILSEL